MSTSGTSLARAISVRRSTRLNVTGVIGSQTIEYMDWPSGPTNSSGTKYRLPISNGYPVSHPGSSDVTNTSLR